MLSKISARDQDACEEAVEILKGHPSPFGGQGDEVKRVAALIHQADLAGRARVSLIIAMQKQMLGSYDISPYHQPTVNHLQGFDILTILTHFVSVQTLPTTSTFAASRDFCESNRTDF